MQRQSLVVIGNGMVGLEFLIQAVKRQLNIRFAITVFGAEPHPAYDRIQLNSAIEGSSVESLIFKPLSWYAEQSIDLRIDRRVEKIDRESKEIITEAGERCGYDILVLATGSRPYIPAIEGVHDPKILTYRDVHDAQVIQKACTTAKSVVIIGGGLLGLELAKTVREKGITTTIVQSRPGLMMKQLNPVAANMLLKQVQAFDITVRLSTHTQSIAARSDNSFELTYKDKETDQADLVIVTTGIRSHDELAQDAKITCSPGGGIVINDHLQTSDPNIFAIGECANHAGIVYGLAAPGYHMAEMLARRLNGGTLSEFRGFDQSTKLKLAGLDVWTIGEYQGDGTTTSRRDGDNYRQIVVRNGRLVGATVIGAWDELPLLQDGVARRIRLSETQQKRLQKSGSLFNDSMDDPAYWPEQALICTCMNVTRGALTLARDDGCHSVEQLTERTGAGSVCGSCKPILGQLVGQELPLETTIRTGNTWLLWVSIAALIAVVPFLFWEIPFETSIATGPGLDVLWRSTAAKQTTGFVLLGFSLISLILSLRKRVIKMGAYGRWRAVHATLGMIALLALVIHSGMRLGANLNLALSLSFLTLAVLGGLAGILSAIENKIGGVRIRSYRQWWIRVHIAVFWLFIPLVGFHIVKSYGY
jgi:nitrite reductase (NADH) large subunit